MSIDALDEHSGNRRRLLAFIWRLEQSDATDKIIFKICVSSRPEPNFVVAFDSCPQFKVHHYTRDDVAKYAQGCLKSNSNASTTELDVAQLEKLGAEVTKKADEVFIWVRLVIQELVEEFVNEVVGSLAKSAEVNIRETVLHGIEDDGKGIKNLSENSSEDENDEEEDDDEEMSSESISQSEPESSASLYADVSDFSSSEDDNDGS